MGLRESSEIRREKLRAVFVAMKDLDAQLDPVEGWMPQSIAVENARDEIFDAFSDGNDIAGTCEGCMSVIMVGDRGHHCRDDVSLCAECAYTWGEVKAQWDKGEITEDMDGEREKFLSAFDAHIAAGGSADDKMLRTM